MRVVKAWFLGAAVAAGAALSGCAARRTQGARRRPGDRRSDRRLHRAGHRRCADTRGVEPFTVISNPK
jgi:hypothetical protein